MERRVTPQPNWMQRYLIQREHARSQPEPLQHEEPIDPLASVKLHYYHLYTKAIGQPGVTPESSPVHANAAHIISHLVGKAVGQAEHFYDSSREMITHMVDRADQPYAVQYLNQLVAELGRIDEKIIEATVRWIAVEDPLMYSRVGRLFRRLKPSPEQKALNDAFSGKKEYKMISRRFLEEMKRRYKR